MRLIILMRLVVHGGGSVMLRVTLRLLGASRTHSLFTRSLVFYFYFPPGLHPLGRIAVVPFYLFINRFIFSVPVHPLHQLFIVFSLEQLVALVKHVHVLVVCHQLTDFLRDLRFVPKKLIHF